MFPRNEEVMGAPGISSCRFSSRPTLPPPLRVKRPGSHSRCTLWMMTLLTVILLAGQAFGQSSIVSPSTTLTPRTAAQTSDQVPSTQTFAAPSTSLTPPTAAHTSAYYSLDVTVNCTVWKTEPEIIIWLAQVFQQGLKDCLFSNPEPTTVAFTSPQATTGINLTETARVKTTQETYNSTTAAVATNGTTAATSGGPEGNGTTTDTTNGGTIPATTAQNVRLIPQISADVNLSVSSGDLSSLISNYTISLFQAMEVSCDKKTDIRNTKCFVVLHLSQRVRPCCILRKLCAASKNSTDIYVVGKKADRMKLHQNDCNSNTQEIQEENTCIYPGPLGASCETSGPSYVVTESNSTQCDADNCSCSAHCNKSEAFYTFSVSLRDPRTNSSNVSHLMSVLEKTQICNITSEEKCQIRITACEYQDADGEGNDTATNLQNCQVVLSFAREVPICSVAEAVKEVFWSEKYISYDGKVQRAAICGNVEVTDNPPQAQFKWLDSSLKHSEFCSETNKSDIKLCQNGTVVVVRLNEQCVVAMPTSNPNATTAQPRTTPISVNGTSSIPNTTAETTQQNTTIVLNVTTTTLNTTVNATTTTLNTTVNATTTMTLNTTVNATTTTLNTTVNATTTATLNTTVHATTSTTLNTTVNAITTAALNTTLSIMTTTPNRPTITTTTSFSETSSWSTTANATAEGQANALLDLTKDISSLSSEQIDQLVSQLEGLLSGPTVSLALGNLSINIISNLLDASPETLSSSSERMIGITDTVGLKLVIGENPQTLLSPAVALSVKPADGTNFQEAVFTISNPDNVQVRGDQRMKRNVMRDSSAPQGSIRLPPSLTEGLTPEEQQLVSRVQFNFYQKSTLFQDKSLGQSKLNSGILGASVANLSITGLRDSVVIQLRNIEPVPGNYVVKCVYWDFELNSGSGGWNSDGCSVQNSTEDETICGCNHLTSFAILLALDREPSISREQATILTFITYIGCGVSAIFLSITLLTYLTFGKLRKDIPSNILIHLCIALLFLNLVFLVDAWLALYPDAVGLCISTAWFLHYFLLASFTWMGLEGVHMYLTIVKVFNSHISRYMLKFSLLGWGVPMIVVIIVIAIDKNNYGLVSYGKFTDGTSDEFCWLKNDVAFYVAVVAYFCVIFVFNVIMFILVLVQIRRIKRQNPHNAQHRTTLQDIRSVAGITILLGLTWGFAFFSWGPVNLAFMYLFAIFNSLQGLFIFIFHCAVKENVRKQWRSYLCCGRMRLPENSEWSRTATQKTVNKLSLTNVTSVNSSNSSRGNNISSSSFIVSDSSEQMTGISSPFEDRAITADELNMDVVLNEINNQYRNQHGS